MCVCVHIFYNGICNGEIIRRLNVRESNILLLWHRHMPQNTIKYHHADFCMHLYAIYNIQNCNWFNYISYYTTYTTIYTRYRTLECRGIPNEGPTKSKIVYVFLGPRPHVLRLLSVLRSILHAFSLWNHHWTWKWPKNTGHIWKLNTSANWLPMKPLSKRSRTSCPHCCIGPVPGHFDHWTNWFVSFDQMHRLVVSESIVVWWSKRWASYSSSSSSNNAITSQVTTIQGTCHMYFSSTF